MKRKLKKQITSIFISVCMLISMLPLEYTCAEIDDKAAAKAEFRNLVINMYKTADISTHDISSLKLSWAETDEIYKDVISNECWLEYACTSNAVKQTTRYKEGKNEYIKTFYIMNMDKKLPDYVKAAKKHIEYIKSHIDSKMTDLDKLVYIHDYIDEINYYKLDESNSYIHKATGPFYFGYSVCDGYANAMSVLLKEVGVTEKRVSSANHAWNLVLIDGEYYHVDATWDDTRNTRTGAYRPHYFMMRNDEEFLNDPFQPHSEFKQYDSETNSYITTFSTSEKFLDWYVQWVVGKMFYYDGYWYYVHRGNIVKNTIYGTEDSYTLILKGDGYTVTGIDGSILEYKDGNDTKTLDLSKIEESESTTKATETTMKPTESTTKPTEAESTTKPTEAEPTAKPTESTTKPTETEPTTKPTEPTTKPTEAESTTKPTEAEPTAKPTESTTRTTEAEPTTKPTEAESTTRTTEAESTTKPTETEPTTKPTEAESTTRTTEAEPTTKPTESTTRTTEAESTTKPTESTTRTTEAESTTKPTEAEPTTKSTESTTKITESETTKPTESTTKITESETTKPTESTTKITEPETTKPTEPTTKTTEAESTTKPTEAESTTKPTESTTKTTEAEPTAKPTESTTKITEPETTKPTESTTRTTEPETTKPTEAETTTKPTEPESTTKQEETTKKDDSSSKKKFKDKKTKAYYKVIKKGKRYGTVIYLKPYKSAKGKVTVPSVIKKNGVKYKVVKIQSNAFRNNKKITYISIGKNIKYIGSKAFYNCKNLKKIKVNSKKLTSSSVNKYALKKIRKKVTIKVPKSRYSKYKKLFVSKGLKTKTQITKK